MLRALSDWSLYDCEEDKGLLGEDNEFLKKRAYSRAIGINDCILVAPMGQFMCMQEKEPVFSDVEGVDKWETIEKVQKAITDFCVRYNGIASWNLQGHVFSTDFLDDFVKVLLDETWVEENVKNSFMIKDLFIENQENRAFE